MGSLRHKFYNLSEVKAIPILDVCDLLGISYKKKGKNYWCKVRDEEHPSVILHTDRNTFYDFGNQEHGSVIDLVIYATGRDVGDSIQYLADSFNIPMCTEKEIKDKPLTNWEYEQIGILGENARLNMIYPIRTATLSELYNAPRCQDTN